MLIENIWFSQSFVVDTTSCFDTAKSRSL